MASIHSFFVHPGPSPSALLRAALALRYHTSKFKYLVAQSLVCISPIRYPPSPLHHEVFVALTARDGLLVLSKAQNGEPPLDRPVASAVRLLTI